jgi:hypothetical protein
MENKKKIVLALGLAILVGLGSFQAQWTAPLADYFGQKKDYGGAVTYLLGNLEKIDESDKPAAYELLAFCCHKLNDTAGERNWITAYFDADVGNEPIFGFLDEQSYADLSRFITDWRIRFPKVADIAIVANRLQSGSSAPALIPLVVDISREAYFRLVSKEGIIKGGLFQAGTNSLNIEAGRFFEDSGTHVFFLDLKAGDIVLRKEINVEIKLENPVPPPEPDRIPPKKVKEPEYKLSMYVGGKLILSNTKLPKDVPLKIEWPKGTVALPKFPRDQANYNLNAFSIPDALSALYSAVKDIVKGKNTKAPEFKYKKEQQSEISFLTTDDEGLQKKVDATIRLKTRTVPFPSGL